MGTTVLANMQMSIDWEQHEPNLNRVSARIGGSILRYFAEYAPGYRFHVEELRKWVLDETGILAPASADRVLRDLRQKGRLDYHVVSRKQSLYQIGPRREV